MCATVTHPPSGQRDRRVARVVAAAVLLDTALFASLPPLVPHFVRVFGLSQADVGLLTAACPAGTIIGTLPAICLLRRTRPAITLRLGLAILMLSSVGVAFAKIPAILLTARLFEGIGGAICWAGAVTWLLSQASATRRERPFAVAVSAAIVGSVLGPLLALFAADIGVRTAFLAFSGIVLVLNQQIARLDISGPDHRLSRITPTYRRVPIAPSVLVVLTPAILFGALSVIVPLDLLDSSRAIYILVGVFLVAAIIEGSLSFISARLSERHGAMRIVQVGLLTCFGVCGAFGVTQVAALVVILYLAFAVAAGLIWTPAMASLTRATDAAGYNLGEGVSASNLAFSGGVFAGAWSAPVLIAIIGRLGYFGFVAILSLATLLAVNRNADAASQYA
jgi:predicted MFS family arabinose efflux permease